MSKTSFCSDWLQVHPALPPALLPTLSFSVCSFVHAMIDDRHFLKQVFLSPSLT